MNDRQQENHPGQHPAIVEQALWDQVQQRLEANRQGHKSQSKAAAPSLLSGKLFDETGRRLIPSHTRKGKKRYRYYVTPADDPGEPIRLPASELEKLVVRAIVEWSASEKRVLDAVGWKDAKRAQEALTGAKKLGQAIQHETGTQIAKAVRRVEVAPEGVRVTLDLVGCGVLKAETKSESKPAAQSGAGQGSITISVPAKRKRCGMAVRLVIGDNAPGQSHKRAPDPTLVALMAKGKAWLQQFTQEGQSIEEIAEREKFSVRYVNRVINIALLAPDIVQAIEQGEHPEEINATKLLTSVPLPEAWKVQREVLGMG